MSTSVALMISGRRISMRFRPAIVVVLLLAFSSLGGCVSWPESSTGGLAELYPSKSVRIADLERRFLELADGRVANHAPALLLEARGWLIRAKREHAGGLLPDAERSADVAERYIEDVEARRPRTARSY